MLQRGQHICSCHLSVYDETHESQQLMQTHSIKKVSTKVIGLNIWLEEDTVQAPVLHRSISVHDPYFATEFGV